jgi:hypothetical protein
MFASFAGKHRQKKEDLGEARPPRTFSFSRSSAGFAGPGGRENKVLEGCTPSKPPAWRVTA